MKKLELAVLAFLLISFFVLMLGTVLYVHKLMVKYTAEWELQLVVFGFLFVIVALVTSRILARVDFDE